MSAGVTRTKEPIRPDWGDPDVVEVPADDVPLLELLETIVDEHVEGSVPETMPARVAVEADDLVDAQELLRDVERGSVPIGGVGYGMSYTLRFARGIEAYREGRQEATLVAVGCSGTKDEAEEPLPARDRYSSSYWSCKEEYGDVVGDDWRIISAEHELLDPDDSIDYYERTVDDLEGVPIDGSGRLPNGDDVDTLQDRWALDVYEQLAAWIDDVAGGPDPRDVELQVLLGRGYRAALEERGVFDRLPAPGELEIAFPFQEVEQAQGGNGHQMGWMTDVVEAHREPHAEAHGEAHQEAQL